MNTELLDRILEAARLAATPSDAMHIEDLQRDLAPLLKVLDSADCDEPMDVAAYVTDFKALSAHALMDSDEAGFDTDGVSDPAKFEAWAEKLWSLAQ